MRLFTIVLANQKGGAGKTTLSSHIAVEAEDRGFGPVAIIDTDPQGGLAMWFNARAAKTPAYITVVKAGLRATLNELDRQDYKLCVIDSPPQVTEAILATVRVADLVVVPVSPSPNDLRAVGATVDLINSTGRPMVFVVNRAINRTRISADTATSLSQHGTVAPVVIGMRVDFATSMIDGRTASELNRTGPSAAEIGELWAYLLKRLNMERTRGHAA